MPTTSEYMQLALRAYAASDKNRIDVPTGWTELSWEPDKWDGFSAGVYMKGNDIVISYTGTNQHVDMASWSLGLPLSPILGQVFDAAAYYLAFKSVYPNANFTFTGHSLGGGLASLMAVFFDKQAVVFDEAPFELAAINPGVLAGLPVVMARSGCWDGSLAAFIASGGTLAQSREANVSEYYVEGEELAALRAKWPTLLGATDVPYTLGNSTAEALDRHSMALLTALHMFPSFKAMAQKLPDLVTELLNDKLFAASDIRLSREDILSKLLRHELGVSGLVQPDAMLTRFTADLQKIAQDGGLSLTEKKVSDALIAYAMQMYYSKETATDPGKHLFDDVSGGIHFARTDVVSSLGNSAKGDRYLLDYLRDNSAGEDNLSSLVGKATDLKDCVAGF